MGFDCYSALLLVHVLMCICFFADCCRIRSFALLCFAIFSACCRLDFDRFSFVRFRLLGRSNASQIIIVGFCCKSKNHVYDAAPPTRILIFRNEKNQQPETSEIAVLCVTAAGNEKVMSICSSAINYEL